MNELQQFIDSGILEMYVLGHVSADEACEVERMAGIYTEVMDELNEISLALERYAATHSAEPEPFAFHFLMARIAYEDRLKNGEEQTFPPKLHEGSLIADYDTWLNRTDLQLGDQFDGAHRHIIGAEQGMTTAIVWLQHGAPTETHTKELEQFLVVEGSCEIHVADEVYHMQRGDVLIVPLHKPHHVKVTSLIPCKLILQRVAA